MSTKVNYIVANYIGPLRHYLHYQELFREDPLFFFKQHIRFLSSIDDFENVFTTFVFNDDIDKNIKEVLEKFEQDKIEIVFRKNSGFSYGIWNDTIIKNLYDYDYFFIIEDDYLPTRVDFISLFKKRIDSRTAFVCGLVDTASAEKFPIQVPLNEASFSFPSISNGLVSGSACREVYEKHGSVFKINYNIDYWSAYANQIYFCKYFTDMGYDIKDILDEYSSPYNNAASRELKIFGDKDKPSLLNPIIV